MRGYAAAGGGGGCEPRAAAAAVARRTRRCRFSGGAGARRHGPRGAHPRFGRRVPRVGRHLCATARVGAGAAGRGHTRGHGRCRGARRHSRGAAAAGRAVRVRAERGPPRAARHVLALGGAAARAAARRPAVPRAGQLVRVVRSPPARGARRAVRTALPLRHPRRGAHRHGRAGHACLPGAVHEVSPRPCTLPCRPCQPQVSRHWRGV
mmetsp:Transcript_7686/g.22817  ORF Transcript_7686/g.22817 Transcript_7686/m.22817 type:complete len:208 (+) Transcript_7686:381-1004(+)